MGTSRHPGDYFSPDECTVTAFQRLGVTAEVTITPTVECGPITITCLTGRVLPADQYEHCQQERGERGQCRLVLFQELCVAVPVTFGAHAVCRLEDVVCGPASTDPAICLLPDGSGQSGSDGSESGSSSPDSSSDDESSGDASSG